MSYDLLEDLMNSHLEAKTGIDPNAPVVEKKFPDVPDLDLISMINQGLKKISNERPDDGYFHPSELDGCSRSIFFNKLYGKPDNKKGDFSVKGKMSLFLGTQIHSMLEDALYKSDRGHCFSAEVPLISEQDRLRGTTDGIWDDDHNRYIFEFKSSKFEYYQMYCKAPDPKHVRQVQCYMYMSGIKVAYILYYAKDTNDMVQHRVEYDFEQVKPILDRIRHIRQHILDRKPPTDPQYLSCDLNGDLNKRCPNYLRCKKFQTKGELPLKVKTLME